MNRQFAFRHLGALVGLAMVFILWAVPSAAQQGTIVAGVRQDVPAPLVSVAREMGWDQTQEDYRLVILPSAAGKPLRLEIFSPLTNLNDYFNYPRRTRGPSYVGDEIYGKDKTMKTRVLLKTSTNQILVDKTYGTGTQHTTDTLFSGSLPTGVYPLRFQSNGFGKNAFFLRANESVIVQASQFTVNARGRFDQDQLVAFTTLERNAVGKTLNFENYDGDSTSEIELFAVSPSGQRFPLRVSADRKWASTPIKITENMLGRWRFIARIKPSTRQFSNSFSLRLRLDNKPLYVEIPQLPPPPKPVPPPPKPEGTLSVKAVVEVCSATIPFEGAVVSVNDQLVRTPTSLKLAPGNYMVIPEPVPDATAAMVEVEVKDKTTSEVTVVYQVVPELRLLGGETSLETGQETEFRAIVSTAFPTAIPFKLTVSSAEGLEIVGNNSLEGTVASGKPAELSFRVRATKAGEGMVMAVLQPSCAEVQAPITVRDPLPPASLQLEKSVNKEEVNPGEAVEYTITVTNPGNTAVQNVRLSDPLVEGLKGDKVDQTFNLAAGESKTFKVPATVDANAPEVMTNTATVTWTGEPLQASATISVRKPEPLAPPPPPPPPPAPPARLTLEKSVNATQVQPGQTVTYTIRVANVGDGKATNVRLVDPLVTGLRGQALDQTFDLNPSEVRTFTITATVEPNAPSPLTNTATVTWTGEPLKASTTIRVVQPPAPPPPPAPPAQLTLEKFVDSEEVQVGDTVQYTLTVSNTGGSPATGVRLSDPLATGLSGDPLNETFDLAAGESRTFSVTVKVAPGAPASITNTATVTWTGQPLTASTTIKVVEPPPPPPPAQLTLEKLVNAQEVQPGDLVEYTITVTNTGGSTATGVRLSDPLAPGITGDALDETFDLAAGESRTFTVMAIVDENAPETITNTASVTWTGQPLKASTTIKVIQPPAAPLAAPAKLTLEKLANTQEAQPGDIVEYTLTVTNTGESKAENIRLVDPLVTGLSGEPLDITFELEPGESRVFTLISIVEETAPDKLTNTATVTWTGDPLKASTTITVVKPPAPAPAKLTLEKLVNPATAQPGDSVEYTITVTNTGETKAENVRLVDPLVAGLKGDKVDETFDLEPDETKTITVQAIVEDNAPGQLVNTANVTWSGEPLKASATVTITRPQPAKLLLTRSPLLPNPALPGEETNVCLQVKNDGGSVGNYILTDDSTELLAPYVDPRFTGALGPGETREHCYPAKTTDGPNASSVLKARLTDPAGALIQTADTPFARVNLGLTKVVDKPLVRPGQPATYTIAVTNPVNRQVTVTLVGNSSLPLEPSENRTLTLQPGVNQFNVVGTPKEPGDYPNDIDVFLNGIKAAPTASALVKAVALPAKERETEIVLATRLDQTPRGGTVILSDRLPVGTTYIMGSSKLQKDARAELGQLDPAVLNKPTTAQASDAIPDPYVSGDRLYWQIPSQLRDTYVLSYRVAHRDPITIPQNAAASIVQLPGIKSAGAPRTQEAILGSRGDIQLLKGEASALEGLKTAIPIGQSGVAGNATAQGGAVAGLSVSPLRLYKDIADQPELVVLARDAQGLAVSEPYVTLQLNTEPETPDAEPTVPGYQVRMSNGEGRVALKNLVNVDTVKGTVRSGNAFSNFEFPVEASLRPLVAAGVASVTLGLDNFNTFSVRAGLNMFLRGDLVGGLLTTGAVNLKYDTTVTGGWIGTNLLPPANPYDRYPLLGDESYNSSDVYSSDCCFLRLERGASYLQWGQFNPGFYGPIIDYSRQSNGAKLLVREGGFFLNGFAAPVVYDNRTEFFRGDATGLYRVTGGNSSAAAPSNPNLGGTSVVEWSEQIRIVSVDRDTRTLVAVGPYLVRGTDYAMDYPSGTIQLRRPVNSFDAFGNLQMVEVRYGVIGLGDWRFGAQAGLDTKAFGIKGTYLKYSADTLFGVGARLGSDQSKLEAEAAFQSGRTAIGAIGNLGLGNFSVYGRFRLTPQGWVDPNSPQLPGAASQTTEASVGAALRLGDVFTIGAGFNFSQVGTTSRQWGAAGVQVPLGPFTVGVSGRVGLNANSGGSALVSLDYHLTKNFSIRLADTILFPGPDSNTLRQSLSLGARGSYTNAELARALWGLDPAVADSVVGTTNIDATYDIFNVLDGGAGVARLGINTEIPLSKQLKADVGAEISFGTSSTLGGSVGLRYEGDDVKASARAQVAQASDGTKLNLGAGVIAKLSPDAIVSPAAEYARLPNGTDGIKFSLAGALRNDDFSLLTNNNLYGGFYKAGDRATFEGEIQTSYEATERLFLRAGVAYIVESGFGVQVGAGLNYFFTDVLGVGVNASFYNKSPVSTLSVGAELSLRLVAGFTVNLGVNANLFGPGTTSLGSFQSRPGLYLRLDYKFDESLFGR